jgi:hypothetical protein
MTNVSAMGVYVATEDLGLAIGTHVELVFAIELGSVIKLHRRGATVVHLRAGGTGFALQARD